MKNLWGDFIFWLIVEDHDRGLFVSRLFVYGGCLLILLGVFGAFAKGAVNALNALKHSIPFDSLESAFPQFPTWWVPETFLGYFPIVCFIGLGLWLNACVKQAQKFTKL